ncbi:MAG: carboxypeptidase-like regulatory domain-containing protein [Candidatus Pacearchaeota archaeon]
MRESSLLRGEKQILLFIILLSLLFLNFYSIFAFEYVTPSHPPYVLENWEKRNRLVWHDADDIKIILTNKNCSLQSWIDFENDCIAWNDEEHKWNGIPDWHEGNEIRFRINGRSRLYALNKWILNGANFSDWTLGRSYWYEAADYKIGWHDADDIKVRVCNPRPSPSNWPTSQPRTDCENISLQTLLEAQSDFPKISCGVKGRVVNESGAGVEGIHVYVLKSLESANQNNPDNLKYYTKTSASGDYIFEMDCNSQEVVFMLKDNPNLNIENCYFIGSGIEINPDNKTIAVGNSIAEWNNILRCISTTNPTEPPDPSSPTLIEAEIDTRDLSAINFNALSLGTLNFKPDPSLFGETCSRNWDSWFWTNWPRPYGRAIVVPKANYVNSKKEAKFDWSKPLIINCSTRDGSYSRTIGTRLSEKGEVLVFNNVINYPNSRSIMAVDKWTMTKSSTTSDAIILRIRRLAKEKASEDASLAIEFNDVLNYHTKELFRCTNIRSDPVASFICWGDPDECLDAVKTSEFVDIKCKIQQDTNWQTPIPTTPPNDQATTGELFWKFDSSLYTAEELGALETFNRVERNILYIRTYGDANRTISYVDRMDKKDYYPSISAGTKVNITCYQKDNPTNKQKIEKMNIDNNERLIYKKKQAGDGDYYDYITVKVDNNDKKMRLMIGRIKSDREICMEKKWWFLFLVCADWRKMENINYGEVIPVDEENVKRDVYVWKNYRLFNCIKDCRENTNTVLARCYNGDERNPYCIDAARNNPYWKEVVCEFYKA